MTIAVRNLSWVYHNTQRPYPFTLEATLKDLTGTFEIPWDFVVGLTLPVHWGVNVKTGNFFLRRLASYSNGYWLTIGYDSESGPIDVASAIVPKASHKPGNYYNLSGVADFIDSRGFIQIGELENIGLQPTGQYEFDLTGAMFEPDVIHPFIRGVMSLQAQNGNDLSALAFGRVVLRAGRNMRLRTVMEANEDPIVIFDAIDGEGLSDECVCDENQANPVRTIQMVGPNGQGNINLLGNECFDVVPAEHALILKDKCSTPCCGCKELEIVTSTLESFGSKATTLENFLVALEERVTAMDQVVFGSRLGDRGCVPAPDCPPCE